MKQRWFDRCERYLGVLCMPQLAAFLVGMNAVVWVMTMLRPDFAAVLSLEPELVMRGQVWRLFTFLLIPPTSSPLGMFLWLYLFYIYATALETEWGDFRFNLFYGIGVVSTAAASMAAGVGLSNAVLNSTIFLAFAALYPDFELLLLFILPVKVKWLAWLAWAAIGWSTLVGDAVTRLTLVAGLVNYGVFFGADHWMDLKLRLKRRR